MESTTEVVITTGLGTLRGLQYTSRQEYLGIRYAQPPVGKLRFMPPQRIDFWQGELDATRYGPMAPQTAVDTPPILLEESEDCLVLNIYTPGAETKRRPVMVYIHGGGFIIDSGSRPRNRGGNLVELGDVVVVSVEYRMGAFGFLYAEGISPNLGLQDQVCALEWVRRHIADFGGDPTNVTIFGQSAGAASVAYLLVMPSARGLFHKAILQSGSFFYDPQKSNLDTLEASAKRFFKHAGLRLGDLQALRCASTESLQSANRKAAGQMLDFSFAPVHDGEIVPHEPLVDLRNGAARDIPVMIGVTSEELPVFGGMKLPFLIRILLKQILLKKITRRGASKAQVQHLLELYRDALPGQAVKQKREYNQLFSDSLFRIPAIIFAEQQLAAGGEVYFYTFAHPSPKTQAAAHVSDLYFVFGTLESGDISNAMRYDCTPEELQLSKLMGKAWTNFARRGTPGIAELPTWPPYDTEERATLSFKLEPNLVLKPMDEVRETWMEIINGGKG